MYYPTQLSLLFLATVGTPIMAVVTSPSILLSTRLGRIRGTIERMEEEDLPPYYAFRGIRYAKAPLGDLRWKEPVAYGVWSSDLDASTYGAQCPQYDRSSGNVIGDEDCLFLNVYTPRFSSDSGGDAIPRQKDKVSAKRSTLGRLPVMVWIHGGAFLQGSSQAYGPSFLMRSRNVVLVTVNYRLGPLGFLSTGDRNLPGNFALLDLIEALKWVRENIHSFGGDAEKVTIFGESAGGVLVHLLTLSQLAAGLLHRAIFQSGSALCDWSIEKNPLEYAQRIAEQVQCPWHPVDLVVCLRSKDAHQLVRAQNALLRYGLFPLRGGPVVDASFRDQPFLSDLPRNVILNKIYKPIPMMSGLTRDEGLLFFLWIYTENMSKMSNAQFLEDKLVPGVIGSMVSNHTHLEDIIALVKQQYLGGIDYTNLQLLTPRFSQIIDDYMFTSCVYEAQILHARTSPVPHFAYLFSYRGQEAPSFTVLFEELVKRSGFNHPILNTGVSHGDELLYIFRMAGVKASYSTADTQMSKMMARYWTQFALKGDPVEHGSSTLDGKPIWSRVSPAGDSVTYFNLNLGRTESGVDFRKAEHNFWFHVVPHVRDKFSAKKKISDTFLSVTWTLVGLFLITAAISIMLTVVIIRKKRKGRYPAKGVVLHPVSS